MHKYLQTFFRSKLFLLSNLLVCLIHSVIKLILIVIILLYHNYQQLKYLVDILFPSLIFFHLLYFKLLINIIKFFLLPSLNHVIMILFAFLPNDLLFSPQFKLKNYI